MATTIQNLRSLTAGNKPGDLAPGELAFNLADGYMYLGNGGNSYIDTLGQTIGPSVNPGGGWQQAIFNAAPITGGVTLAGIYDAQANLVTSVTPAGDAAGFTANAALPAAGPGNEGYYVLVQIGGTLTPPAPTGDAQPGDWLVSSGTGWALVAESSVVIPASNVTIVPTGDFTGPSMQDVLNQIQLLYVSIADGTMSQLNCNGDALVYGNTTLGDASTDDLTVNATSAFAAPVAMASTLAVTGAVACSSTLFVQTNATVQGNLTVNGNTSLGNAATDTVTIAGPISAGNNLTVTGVTALNGATQITGALTTTGSIALTGSAGITLSTNLGTSGTIGITIGGSADLGINSTNVNFYGGSVTNWRGQLNLTQGLGGTTTINYARPIQAPAGQVVNENLNNFLVVPGTIIAFGGNTLPGGYVPCDGRSLSNAGQYADLFAAIGYAWGGSGANFNVPDLRGMFVRGSGTNAKFRTASNQLPAGPAVGAGQTDQFLQHSHTLNLNTGDYAAGFRDQRGVLAPAESQQMTGQKTSGGTLDNVLTQEGGQPIQVSPATVSGINETRALSAGVYYLIKY